MSTTHCCHNAKCKKKLLGNFICINHGGLEKVNEETSICSGKIEGFFDVTTHSNGAGPFGSVNLYSKSQYNYDAQAESYFCSKQCLIDWFTRKLKDLPEPGTEEHVFDEND